MGKELIERSEFKEIDMVIPVPLHRKKFRSRGFNQVEDFGKEIAAAIQIPYEVKVLLKKSNSTTQTIKICLARGQHRRNFCFGKSRKNKEQTYITGR